MNLFVSLLLCVSLAVQDENVARHSKNPFFGVRQRKCNLKSCVLNKFRRNVFPLSYQQYSDSSALGSLEIDRSLGFGAKEQDFGTANNAIVIPQIIIYPRTLPIQINTSANSFDNIFSSSDNSGSHFSTVLEKNIVNLLRRNYPFIPISSIFRFSKIFVSRFPSSRLTYLSTNPYFSLENNRLNLSLVREILRMFNVYLQNNHKLPQNSADMSSSTYFINSGNNDNQNSFLQLLINSCRRRGITSLKFCLTNSLNSAPPMTEYLSYINDFSSSFNNQNSPLEKNFSQENNSPPSLTLQNLLLLLNNKPAPLNSASLLSNLLSSLRSNRIYSYSLREPLLFLLNKLRSSKSNILLNNLGNHNSVEFLLDQPNQVNTLFSYAENNPFYQKLYDSSSELLKNEAEFSMNNDFLQYNNPNSILAVHQPNSNDFLNQEELTNTDNHPSFNDFSVVSDDYYPDQSDNYFTLNEDIMNNDNLEDNPLPYYHFNNLFSSDDQFFSKNSLNNDDRNINLPISNCIRYLYSIFQQMLELQRFYSNCKSLISVQPEAATYPARNSPFITGIVEYDNNREGTNRDYLNLQDQLLYGIKRGEITELSIGDRIIGGRLALPGEIPYQVALYKLDIFACGSSLISPFYVITAAHCLNGVQLKELWFRVGSEALTKGGETYRVITFMIHEQYVNGDNDIGLIKSATRVKIGPHVKPIRLPSPSDPPIATFTPVQASGWGATSLDNGGPPAYKLHTVDLQIASREQCRKRIMASSRVISNRQICTTAPIRAGTCFGDSGGPLVANGKLVGIVSWGSPCAIGDPDVYTNVQAYLPWIYNKIKNLDQNSHFRQLPPSNFLPIFNNFGYETYRPYFYK